MKRPGFGPSGLVGSIVLSTAILCAPKTAVAGDARTHDGLYLRLGGGFGYAADSVKTDAYSAGVPPFVVVTQIDGTATGFAGASELALGWSLADGFALGGGLYSAWIFSPESDDVGVDVNGLQVRGTAEFDASSFHVFGPFVDYYFDPLAGLHLQGGLGYAWISPGDVHFRGVIPLLGPYDVSGPSASGGGFGFMVGLGNEWWVSDAFSLGLLARLTAGFMSGEQNNVNWNHTAFAPALLFTATMN
jgi:hypothetical protein